MPYAANDIISQDPIEGGIYITDDQYSSALEGMMAGKEISVADGQMTIDFPVEPVVSADEMISNNIENAPSGLFGGPTLKEVFDGN